jgi:hypothetical protein
LGTTGLYRPPLPKETRLAKAGEKMRAIKTTRPGVTWLQGPGPSDLFTLHGEGDRIEEQELTFFGRTVVINKDGGLATGLCHEGPSAGYMGKTGLLDFDTKLNPETLEGALVLLSHIPFQHPDAASISTRIRAVLTELKI